MVEMTPVLQGQSVEREGMPLDAFLKAQAESPFELIDGKRIPIMATTERHVETVRSLYTSLVIYLHSNSVATAFSEATFAIGESSNWVKGSRRPDISVYEQKRWQAYRDRPTFGDGPLRLVPDWSIEILSENDKGIAVNQKARQYLADGVRLVWVIDPVEGILTIFLRDGLRIASATDEITGDPVLPDYRITLRAVLPASADPADDEAQT